MAGGGGGRLFEGGDYLKYFGQRGAIIRGRRLIEGRLLFEEIRYLIFIILICLFIFSFQLFPYYFRVFIKNCSSRRMV